MKPSIREQFTRYEIARIIGARALQIAMDAPLLVKITKEKLEEMRYDALRIAEYELDEEVLPITIHRPTPKRGRDKLAILREEVISDVELTEKEKELEKEIVENPEEYSLVEEEEHIDAEPSTGTEEAQ